MQKIKDERDHLAAAGVVFKDDIILLSFKGLIVEYNTFRCVIRGRENNVSIKDFRSQLLAKEATINQSLETAIPFGTAMVASTLLSNGKALVLDSHPTYSIDFAFSSRSGSH